MRKRIYKTKSSFIVDAKENVFNTSIITSDDELMNLKKKIEDIEEEIRENELEKEREEIEDKVRSEVNEVIDIDELERDTIEEKIEHNEILKDKDDFGSNPEREIMRALENGYGENFGF